MNTVSQVNRGIPETTATPLLRATPDHTTVDTPSPGFFQPSTSVPQDTWRPYALSALPTQPSQVAAPGPGGPAEQALGLVITLLDKSVAGLSATTARAAMTERYQAMRLMDAQGQWTVPELARYSDFLLPRDLDGAKMVDFVERMADTARDNPYLMKFLAAASTEDFPALREKVRAEGDQVFPDVLLHAQVLERLTTVLADDYKNSEACREHWKQFESDPEFWSNMNAFQKAKFVSVNMGIDKYNKIHETGIVDPNTLAFVLPLNIMEAVAVDVYHGTISKVGRQCREGHQGNAHAGWTLATHGPHGDGPSTMSPDGKMVELKQKEVKSWDDLYSTWNMSFVTVSQEWPYYLAKLAIPQVSDYKDRPGEYINKRALALHLTMTTIALAGTQATVNGVNWLDPKLSDLWGKVNAESALEYAALADGKQPRSGQRPIQTP